MAITTSSGDGYCLYNGAKVLASEVPEGAESIALDGMTVIEWDGDTEGLTNEGAHYLVSTKTPDVNKLGVSVWSSSEDNSVLSTVSQAAADNSYNTNIYDWGANPDNDNIDSVHYNTEAGGYYEAVGIYLYKNTISTANCYCSLFAFYEAGSTDSGSESTAQQGTVSRAAMVATADAIRAKLGTTDQIQWEVEKGFAEAIAGIGGVIIVATVDELPADAADGSCAIVTG